MNYVFKILALACLLGPSIAPGREIILVTYEEPRQKELVELTHKLLTKDLGLPESFIVLRQKSHPCDKLQNTIIHFCFDRHDELWPVSFDREIAVEKFKVFLNQDKREER